MFETGFGRELRHLLSVVSPLDGSKEWSLIEVYFSAVRDVPLTWFDGITGSADIKLYVKQQCFDREIKNVGDFIIATQPMLLQNPDAFSMPTVLSYSQQASLLMSIIKLSCHDGAEQDGTISRGRREYFLQYLFRITEPVRVDIPRLLTHKRNT